MKRLSNLEKVAILLIGFGEDISAEIFKSMSESEIRKVSGAIRKMGRLDATEIDKILAEFYEFMQKPTNTLSGGADYTNKVLSQALGPEKAHGLIPKHATMESVNLVEADVLTRIIRNEHPQTIALILAHMEPSRCGQVLKGLPQSIHADILIRITHLEEVSPDMIEEIDNYLKSEIEKIGNWGTQKLGGYQKAAAILGALESAQRGQLLTQLEERDKNLPTELKNLMFTFEDLIRLSGQSIQLLLKHIQTKTLLTALKIASEGLLNHFLGNMSSRAATRLKEDFESMPKLKLTEVHTAQGEIMLQAQRLIEEGKITILEDGDELV